MNDPLQQWYREQKQLKAQREREKEPERIAAINQQLNKLKQGSITELTQTPGNTLPKWNECMPTEANAIVENYLIKDIVAIIRNYLDWNNIDHIPLFSVPLHTIRFGRPNHFCLIQIILFGRTDEKEFTLCYDGNKTKVSGHFPLIVDSLRSKINVEDDDPWTLYLVGFIGFDNAPKLFNPKLEGVLFVWTKGCAHAIGFNRPYALLLNPYHDYFIFTVQSGFLVKFYDPDRVRIEEELGYSNEELGYSNF